MIAAQFYPFVAMRAAAEDMLRHLRFMQAFTAAIAAVITLLEAWIIKKLVAPTVRAEFERGRRGTTRA